MVWVENLIHLNSLLIVPKKMFYIQELFLIATTIATIFEQVISYEIGQFCILIGNLANLRLHEPCPVVYMSVHLTVKTPWFPCLLHDNIVHLFAILRLSLRDESIVISLNSRAQAPFSLIVDQKKDTYNEVIFIGERRVLEFVRQSRRILDGLVDLLLVTAH